LKVKEQEEANDPKYCH
jgi:hypothetical protein